MQLDVPARPCDDARWRHLSNDGNSAFFAGDDARAKELYGRAVEEAERLFAAALLGSSAASEIAPVLLTISLHNSAALERRLGHRGASSAMVEAAFDRLVATASSAKAPLALRASCAKNLRHALAGIIEERGEHDLAGLQPFVARAMGAWCAMRGAVGDFAAGGPVVDVTSNRRVANEAREAAPVA